MVQWSDWKGLISDQRVDAADCRLRSPLAPSSYGGSGAFIGLADDDQRYWIKTLNNGQGQLIPVTEQIVGRVGALVGAPTCQVRLVEIGADLAGWEFAWGQKLEPSIAHGSRDVSKANPTNRLGYRRDDDNRLRHAYILGLYDWCWGSDPQWLVDDSDQHQFHSHDHGHYFPPSDRDVWSGPELRQMIGEPHEFTDDFIGIDSFAIIEVADRIESITRADLLSVLTTIPASWPVSDEDLEAVGFFLEYRAHEAAARLRERIGGTK